MYKVLRKVDVLGRNDLARRLKSSLNHFLVDLTSLTFLSRRNILILINKWRIKRQKKQMFWSKLGSKNWNPNFQRLSSMMALLLNVVGVTSMWQISWIITFCENELHILESLWYNSVVGHHYSFFPVYRLKVDNLTAVFFSFSLLSTSVQNSELIFHSA